MVYRIKQLWWAMTARPVSAEIVTPHLAPDELALFQLFSPNDQQHGVRVMTLLQTRNATHPSLIKAALIHDVGKTKLSLTVWDRCFIVLASLLLPRRSAAWGLDETKQNSWHKPFIVKQHHARWGAEMAASSDPLTRDLIARHQDKVIRSDDPAADELLALLQWADDQS